MISNERNYTDAHSENNGGVLILSSKGANCQVIDVKELKLLKNLRKLDSCCDVKEYLTKKGVLSKELAVKIYSAIYDIGRSCGLNDSFKRERFVENFILKAIAIKNICEKTHYVFTHGQMTPWLLHTFLVKQLVKVFQKERDIHNYNFLRSPFLQDRLSVQNYRQLLQMDNKISDINPELSEKLLSVDACILNTSVGESALFFNFWNKNVTGNSETILKECEKRLREFTTSQLTENALKPFIERFHLISQKFERIKAEVGNLWTICIPKTNIQKSGDQFIYRAHPGGRPCDCPNSQNGKDILMLEQMQTDIVNCRSRCSTGSIPQFRLLASALTPENGVLTFVLTPLAIDEKSALKKEIAALAHDLHDKTKGISIE